jgi:hypothetical protein
MTVYIGACYGTRDGRCHRASHGSSFGEVVAGLWQKKRKKKTFGYPYGITSPTRVGSFRRRRRRQRFYHPSTATFLVAETNLSSLLNHR